MSDSHASPPPKILCVDDEPLIIDIMRELLADKYELRAAASGEECLEKLAQWRPDLVLLDVIMPGMDGLETCRQIRGHEQFADIPVIFVSAASSEQERVAGFSAGGHDYITKPFNEEELLFKVTRTLETRARIKALESGSQQARKNESVAVTAAAEMQVALKFMRESFTPESLEALAELLLNAVQELGLNACVHFHCKNNEAYFSNKGEVGPLEKSVFEYIGAHDDLTMSGPRALVATEKVRVLISNLPTDDPSRSGRIRAHLKMMCGGASSRIRALEIENGLERQRKVLSTVMQRTNMALVELFHSHQMRQAMGRKVLDELSRDIQDSYVTLGLEVDQEEALNRKLDSSNHKLEALFVGGEKLDELFSSLMEDIQEVLDSRPENIASRASKLDLASNASKIPA